MTNKIKYKNRIKPIDLNMYKQDVTIDDLIEAIDNGLEENSLSDMYIAYALIIKRNAELKTEKDKLLIELGKLVANNEENAGYLLCNARYMYPDLTTLNRMEELIKQIGEME